MCHCGRGSKPRETWAGAALSGHQLGGALRDRPRRYPDSDADSASARSTSAVLPDFRGAISCTVAFVPTDWLTGGRPSGDPNAMSQPTERRGFGALGVFRTAASGSLNKPAAFLSARCVVSIVHAWKAEFNESWRITTCRRSCRVLNYPRIAEGAVPSRYCIVAVVRAGPVCDDFAPVYASPRASLSALRSSRLASSS